VYNRTGMSASDVLVTIKTLTGGFIAHKFNKLEGRWVW
jgi:hypothetical protein